MLQSNERTEWREQHGLSVDTKINVLKLFVSTQRQTQTLNVNAPFGVYLYLRLVKQLRFFCTKNGNG